MIRTSRLNKTYGSLHVLKDIDIHIKPSEIVALMGASGAGKTTLLQIVGTLDKADSGQVFINSKDITQFSDNKLSNIFSALYVFSF